MLEILLAQVLSLAPAPRVIVAPNEPMIALPAFANLGPSRQSTVQHCENIVGKTYSNLLTDSDFENFEACLIEHT